MMTVATRFLACLGVAGLLGVAVMAVPHASADDMGGSPTTAPTTAPTSQPTAATNTKCPVTGDAVDPTVTTVYNGKTYAFCCSDCVKSFNKDPEKYISKTK